MNLLLLLGFVSAISAQEISKSSFNILKFYTLQSNAELSELCKTQSDIYYRSLVSDFKQMWSKRMIDSSTKIQPGILSGRMVDLGAFDQCLAINNQDDGIKGKFCYTKITIPLPKNRGFEHDIETIDPRLMDMIQPFVNTRPTIEFNKIVLRWSFCVPSGCSADDVKAHLNSYFHLNISLPITIPNIFDVDENDCHSLDTKSKLNTGDWTVIGILIVILCIIVVSTAYDVYLYYTKRETTYKILVAFSWYTNLKNLSKINNNSDQLPCLNGIRFLSILWIIHGHELSTYITGPVVNSNDVMHWAQWELWSWFTIGSTVSVDTFFVLSGCLLMYGFLKSQAKNIRFNIPLFYIHRYIRLTPAFAAVVIFHITLLTHMGSGPLWSDAVDESQSRCKDYWWSSLLYIQNYVNPNHHCVGQSWYLSVDMQLYILSPIILLPVKRWRKCVPYLFTGLMIIFTIIPTIVAWTNDLNTSGRQPEQFKVYYIHFYTRAGPWIFGLLLGYILFNTKDTVIRINKFLVAFLWLITIFAILFIIFSNYRSLRDDYERSRIYDALFIGLHRNIWAFAMGWIIFSCLNGYGGPVNWFLSLSMFQFFAKLTYSSYLLHTAIQKIRLGNLRINTFFSNISVLFYFFGTTCLTLFFAIMWILTFEYPFGVIDNILIGGVMNLIRSSHRNDPVKKTIKS